jgi:hypothetical protein
MSEAGAPPLPYVAAQLEPCDLRDCEGMCCHDGVYLDEGEARRLRRLVFQRRADLPGLPDRFLEHIGGAEKTAVRPHAYTLADWPDHFPRTRCVFAAPDARCLLQLLAERDGAHPWAYKPRACWMHPLRESATGPLPPPQDPANDWDRADGYPGYVCFTRCGRHSPGGRGWQEVLATELARWRSERR